jgi:transposase-like protein
VVADFVFGPMYRHQLRAMQALYDAEHCRGRLDPAAGNAWLTAADACRKGQLAWDEAYANWRAGETLLRDNRMEVDHGQLKRRLRPMRGLKTPAGVRVVVAGRAFVQNLRRGHYERAADEPAPLRIAVAFDQLAPAI